jgi:hypothetical protein
VDEDDMRRQFAIWSTVDRYVAAVRRYLGAGVDQVVPLNAGPDPDGFIDLFGRELADALRARVRVRVIR